MIKKLFNSLLITSVVLWSTGTSLLLPNTTLAATCPTLNVGEMVKVVEPDEATPENPNPRPAIYSLNNNLELLPFPDGDVFKSWNTGNSYSGTYTEITDACFMTLKSPAAQPLFTNYRPGSNVVHRQSSDALFAVLPDNTLSSITQTAAAGLYGSDFKAMEVRVEHWGAYVNEGTAITDSMAHSGMLVENGGKTWYVDGSMKREVTAAGMTANRFKPAFVRPVTDAMVAGLSAGDVIDGEVKALTDRSQGGGVDLPSTPTPDSAEDANTLEDTSTNDTSDTSSPLDTLTVAKAANNPSGQIITLNPSSATHLTYDILKATVTASDDRGFTPSVLEFTRLGTGSDSYLNKIALYAGSTFVASNPIISNGKITFSDDNGLFTVSKGTEQTITLKMTLENNTTAGKTFAFSIQSKNDITVNGGNIAGSFPISGNFFTTATTAPEPVIIATPNLTVSLAADNPGPNTFTVNTTSGATDTTQVLKLKFTADNTADIIVTDLTLTKTGDGTDSSIVGVTINDGSAVVSTDEFITSGKAVFSNSNGLFTIAKNSSKPITIELKTASNQPDNRTFRFSVNAASDIKTKDTANITNPFPVTGNWFTSDRPFLFLGETITITPLPTATSSNSVWNTFGSFGITNKTPLTDTNFGIFDHLSNGTEPRSMSFVSQGNKIIGYDNANKGQQESTTFFSFDPVVDPVAFVPSFSSELHFVQVLENGLVVMHPEGKGQSWMLDTRRSGCVDDYISTKPVIQKYDNSNSAYQASVSNGQDRAYVITSYPVSSGSCATTTQNEVYAINLNNGSVAWAFNSSGDYGVNASIAGCELDYETNMLYCGTNNEFNSQNSLWGINTLTGEVEWATFGIAAIKVKPALVNDRVYVASLDGQVHSINKTTGDVVWSLQVTNSLLSGTELWAGYTDDSNKRSLILSDGAKVYRIKDEINVGSLQWSYAPNAQINESPIVTTKVGKVYVGLTNGKISQVNLTTGVEDASATVSPSGVAVDGLTLDLVGNYKDYNFLTATSGQDIRRYSIPWTVGSIGTK